MPTNWGSLPYHFMCVTDWIGRKLVQIWNHDTARRSILIMVMLAMVVIAHYFIWTG